MVFSSEQLLHDVSLDFRALTPFSAKRTERGEPSQE